MLSIGEYSKKMGVSRRRVLAMIKDGKLNGVRQGKKWYVVERGLSKQIGDVVKKTEKGLSQRGKGGVVKKVGGLSKDDVLTTSDIEVINKVGQAEIEQAEIKSLIQCRREIDRLASFIIGNYPNELSGERSESAVDVAIRLLTNELSVRGNPEKETDWTLAIQRVSNEEILAEVKRRGLLRGRIGKASKASHRGGSGDKGSMDIFKEAETRGITVVELLKLKRGKLGGKDEHTQKCK